MLMKAKKNIANSFLSALVFGICAVVCGSLFRYETSRSETHPNHYFAIAFLLAELALGITAVRKFDKGMEAWKAKR